jgi:hypothetical protein
MGSTPGSGATVLPITLPNRGRDKKPSQPEYLPKRRATVSRTAAPEHLSNWCDTLTPHALQQSPAQDFHQLLTQITSLGGL